MRRSIKKYVRHNKSLILTVTGAIGTVAATITAAVATKKAIDAIHKIEVDNNLLSAKDKVKIAAPYYIAPTALCVGSVVCIFGSHKIDRREKMALVGSCAAAGTAFGEYKNTIVDLIGSEDEEKIRNKVLENKHLSLPEKSNPEQVLFYDEFTGEYFYSTLADMFAAQNQVNRSFETDGEVGLDQFYGLLGRKTNFDRLKLYGWSVIQAMDQGFSWIDIEIRPVTIDEQTCMVISYLHSPVVYYWCYESSLVGSPEPEEDIYESNIVYRHAGDKTSGEDSD